MPGFSCLLMNSREDDILTPDCQGEDQQGKLTDTLTETASRPVGLPKTELWRWSPTKHKSNIRNTKELQGGW